MPLSDGVHKVLLLHMVNILHLVHQLLQSGPHLHYCVELHQNIINHSSFSSHPLLLLLELPHTVPEINHKPSHLFAFHLISIKLLYSLE